VLEPLGKLLAAPFVDDVPPATAVCDGIDGIDKLAILLACCCIVPSSDVNCACAASRFSA